jgi:hypothetical protein
MKFDRDLSYSPTQSKLDLELATIMSLSAKEAATYSAQAFSEVKAILEEVEEATEVKVCVNFHESAYMMFRN